MNWYLEVLKKYMVFTGRASRSEYWYFALFNLIIIIILSIIDGATGNFNPNMGLGLFGTIYELAVLLPTIAVAIRRLHDTNRSGWWLLIGFVPIVGGLVLLAFMIFDSHPGTNQYGPNPKGVA